MRNCSLHTTTPTTTALLRMFHLITLSTPALWVANHTSQVKSTATLSLPGTTSATVLFTGSQFTADQSVTALDMQSGRVLWSSNQLGQWTYGVALQPVQRGTAAPALAAFGCQFDAQAAAVPPCELGFWKNATNGSLSWKISIPDAELSANFGPPFVAFSPDGESILVTFIDRNSTKHPGGEFLAVVPVHGKKDGLHTNSPGAPSRALLGAGHGHGLHLLHPAAAAVNSTTQALLTLPPPPPPSPPPTPPWLPATDCNPPCNASNARCCNNPPSGQMYGICLGSSAQPISSCSQVPHITTNEPQQPLIVGRQGAHSLLKIDAASAAASTPTGLGVGAAYERHYAVELVPGSPISVDKTPSIDCNGTSACTWLASTPDLSAVLVDAKPTVPSGSACMPFHWGFAWMQRQGNTWPPTYSTSWIKCGDRSRMLMTAHLDPSGRRILATFAIIKQAGSTIDLLGAEACAFRAADASQIWCTPPFNVSLPTGTAPVFVSAVGENGQLAFHMAQVGLLAVDASPDVVSAADAGGPAIKLAYNSSGNCCAATAVVVASSMAVVSIPDGSKSGIWCQCQHSKLVGVAI